MGKYLNYIINNGIEAESNKLNKKMKLENLLYVLSIRSKIRLDSPTIVGLDITSKCNLKCKHCFIGNRSLENELNTDEIMRFLKKIKQMGTYQVYIMGGEPFCRKDMVEIIKYIKKLGMTISINTNALLISEEDCKELSSILDPECDWIQVSLDGAKPETHDYIRNKQVFNTVINKIKMLTENNISVRVNTVVTKVNLNELKDIYNLCYKLGVKRLNYNPLYPFKGDEYKLSVPSDKEYIKAFEEVLEFHESLSKPVFIQQDPICIPYKVSEFEESMRRDIDKLPIMNCRAGIYSFEMDPIGNVYPCTFMHNDDFFAGNIRETDIEEIWKDDSRWTTILSRNYNNTVCGDCEFIDKCKGGCMAAAHDYYGDINNNDPRCNLGN
ncbi:radical SAM additional 4Fe4S-binding SPASM domain-containing protein [Clostridium collagenovorans DSM 3089]|uniref:Radical SAM additional 4Fe4S-binding SPASM domain-containing protein n=1 Tax=Clostridium collagenovorans DSM 3089 TaxID=1121306 RepID=A0A1M5X6X8_9CLOT|nr:radical SAM protein [Clostridium collagenovorans]SHH95254.1 radical SAM additional 4Fe4S-binding SPASM domain-containing protein [Clostridium collagenovorans DSM 3089]